jgi:hypothetical protein
MIRPATEDLTNKSENDKNDTSIKYFTPISPFLQKKLLKFVPHRVVAVSRVFINLTLLLSPAAFVIVFEFVNSSLVFTPKDVTPL